MTRLETPFVRQGGLILVEGFVTGPLGTSKGHFVLDTGAVMTTMNPEFADQLGYSARDGIQRTRFLDELNYDVRSAEHCIRVEEIEPTA